MVAPVHKTAAARPVIRWTSEFFTGSGYAPEVRCALVSKKFQAAYERNPNFIFAAQVVNGEMMTCAVDAPLGACTTLLYTLKKGVQNPILTVARLNKVRAGASGPINESSSGSSSSGAVSVQDVVADVLGTDFESAPAAVSPTMTPSTSSAGPASQPIW
jgi:hypothetical protein